MFDPVIGIHRDLILIPNKRDGRASIRLLGRSYVQAEFEADRTWKGPLYADLIFRTFLFDDGGSPASCR